MDQLINLQIKIKTSLLISFGNFNTVHLIFKLDSLYAISDQFMQVFFVVETLLLLVLQFIYANQEKKHLTHCEQNLH